MKKTGLLIFCSILLLLSKPVFAEELANVNGVSITADDFTKAISNAPPQVKSQLATPEGKKRVLDRLVDRELMIQEGKKAGMDKDPDYLEEVELAKKNILIDRMVQKIQKEKSTDQEMRQYFNKNIKDFKLVRASHILVPTEDEALKIKKELSAGGNFSELAKKYSKDTMSAENGGDLNFFNENQMVKPFANLAFSLKVNEMGGPVKTQFGYHLIKVTDIKSPKYEDLTQENKNTISNALINSELEKIKAKTKIKINEEALKKLK